MKHIGGISILMAGTVLATTVTVRYATSGLTTSSAFFGHSGADGISTHPSRDTGRLLKIDDLANSEKPVRIPPQEAFNLQLYPGNYDIRPVYEPPRPTANFPFDFDMAFADLFNDGKKQNTHTISQSTADHDSPPSQPFVNLLTDDSAEPYHHLKQQASDDLIEYIDSSATGPAAFPPADNTWYPSALPEPDYDETDLTRNALAQTTGYTSAAAVEQVFYNPRGRTQVSGHMLVVDDNQLNLTGKRSLNITDGGEVFLTGSLAVDSPNAFIIDGSGSSAHIADQLVVGNKSGGSLMISSGSRVKTNGLDIAVTNTSQGEVTVTGSGSILSVNNDVNIGQAGSGVLELRDHGQLNVGQNVRINQNGTLLLVDNGQVQAKQIDVLGGLLKGSGRITANVINTGRLDIGNSIGHIVIEGDYEQSGVLEVEIDTNGNIDLLEVTGQATITGDLDMIFLDDILPTYGEHLTFLQAGNGVNGRFGTIDGLDITEFLCWGVTYESDAVSVAYALLGDANLNGRVNRQDRDIVESFMGYTTPVGRSEGDLNSDGIVDQLDYDMVTATWRMRFTPDMAHIPEPSTSLLMLCLVTLVIRHPTGGRYKAV